MLQKCNPRTKCIVSEEILRFAQDDIRATEIATSGTVLLAMTTPCVVILNGVKNLLEVDKRPRTKCIANEGILRCTQDDILVHQHNRGHLTISRVTKM